MWFYDWTAASPLSESVLGSWFASIVKPILMPPDWLENASAVPQSTTQHAVDDHAAAEAALDAALGRTLSGALCEQTIAGHRNPFLKLTLWLALHNYAFNPPVPQDVARYLTFIVSKRRNVGCAQLARQALR